MHSGKRLLEYLYIINPTLYKNIFLKGRTSVERKSGLDVINNMRNSIFLIFAFVAKI